MPSAAAALSLATMLLRNRAVLAAVLRNPTLTSKLELFFFVKAPGTDDYAHLLPDSGDADTVGIIACFTLLTSRARCSVTWLP